MTSECRALGSSVASALAPVLTAVLRADVHRCGGARRAAAGQSRRHARHPSARKSRRRACRAESSRRGRGAPGGVATGARGQHHKGGWRGRQHERPSRVGRPARELQYYRTNRGTSRPASRDRFMRLMSERFDALDKQKSGALPVDDVRRMLGGVAAK